MLFLQVNLALLDLIRASKAKLKEEEWACLPERESGKQDKSSCKCQCIFSVYSVYVLCNLKLLDVVILTNYVNQGGSFWGCQYP